MTKKWIFTALAMCCFGSDAWTQDNQTVEQQLEELRQIIMEQQKQIESLSAKCKQNEEQAAASTKKDDVEQAAVKPSEKSEVKTEEKSGVAIKWNDAYGEIRLNGDIRFRAESLNTEERDRDRLRTRLRFGGTWLSRDKSWEIGFGLATNKSSTSTNFTWAGDGSEDFGHMDFDLDYAYARHYMDGELGKHSFTIGQAKNPYISAGILWDGDITPLGFTYGFKGNSGSFFTAGIYELADMGNDTIEYKSWMFAAQAGTVFKGEHVDGKLSVGAYILNNRNDSRTESDVSVYGDGNFKFQILQAYGELSTKIKNTKLTAYADVWYNFGADGEVSGNGFEPGSKADGEDALGVVLGLKSGFGAWSLSGEYVYSGAHASYWYLSDGDFGNGISYGAGNCRDVQGLRFKAAYAFNKNISLNGTYMYYQRLNDYQVNNDKGHCFQLDLTYKF